MKLNKYIYVFMVLLLCLSACSDDLDKVTYHPGDAKAGEMSPVKANYILDQENPDAVIDVFKWGKMDFGYAASINYIVEVDLAGKNFENAQEVTASTDLEVNIVASVLNASMNNLQKVYNFVHGTSQAVEFRIKGSISDAATPVYSTVVSSAVTSYFEYPKVWVIGSYSSWSWDDVNSQVLFAFDDEKPNEHIGWIDFGGKAAEGFKITNSKDWEHANFGASKEGGESEPDEMVLLDDGGSKDIKVYGKNIYNFKFDKKAGKLTKLASMNAMGIYGSALNNEDVEMGFKASTQEFSAVVTVENGEIYFRGDKSDEGVVYGMGSTEGQLASGKTGITINAGTYLVTLNLNNPQNLIYTIEEADPIDPSKLIAPKLAIEGDLKVTEKQKLKISWSAVDFVDQLPSSVKYTLEMALAGSDFATSVVLADTKGLDFEITGTELLVKLQELKASVALDESTDVVWRVSASVVGVGVPLISDVVANALAINTEPEYPENLYMIGEQFGSWNWDADEIVTLIPVAGDGNEGRFWTIKYIEAGKGFKWSVDRNWDAKNFAELDNSFGYVVADGNAQVEVSGLYMIYVDMKLNVISVETPQLFGTGNAFNGYDNPMPMTITDAKASITTLKADELRLFVSNSKAEGVDWWMMEFTVRDGEILYRGKGGDISPATKVIEGQLVTLDFANGTGSIE